MQIPILYNCEAQSFLDSLNLQRDLDMFLSWYQHNKLFLNIIECKKITCINRLSNKISLKRVNEIKYLEILFDATFSFVQHIDFITSITYSMLGFIMRICDDLNSTLVFKLLYLLLTVQSLTMQLSCGVQLWCAHIRRIQSIQNSFFSLLFKVWFSLLPIWINVVS